MSNNVHEHLLQKARDVVRMRHDADFVWADFAEIGRRRAKLACVDVADFRRDPRPTTQFDAMTISAKSSHTWAASSLLPRGFAHDYDTPVVN